MTDPRSIRELRSVVKDLVWARGTLAIVFALISVWMLTEARWGWAIYDAVIACMWAFVTYTAWRDHLRR